MALTVGISEAKTNLSRIADEIKKTGESVTVFKNNKPYFKMVPVNEPADEKYCPNPETLEAMAEVEAMIADPNHKPYDNLEDFFEALYKD